MNCTSEEDPPPIWFVVPRDIYVTVGILANLLVLRVLWQRKMRNNSFNTLRGKHCNRGLLSANSWQVAKYFIHRDYAHFF